MASLLNRARMTTSTAGTGTVTLGSAVTRFASFAEAGAVNATVYHYLIEDGDDFEVGLGTYTSSGTTFSRDTVLLSKIAGVSGTTKITLSGSATVSIVFLTGSSDAIAFGGSVITSGTAVASTSGTSIDFTGIPAWVKRITVMFSGVSTNGTSNITVQIGDSGGVENTNYLGSSGYIQNAGVSVTFNLSSGWAFATAAANVNHGTLVLTLVDSATNTWSGFGVIGLSNSAIPIMIGGSKALSATLDRVRITTAGGADTFDAGTINILYE